jgi:hypothetical protein
VILVFATALFALWFLNRLIKVRGTAWRDPITINSRPAAQPTDSSRSDRDEPRKTVEPEAAPDEKDYGVPPIDIVPGNSRVPGKQ